MARFLHVNRYPLRSKTLYTDAPRACTPAPGVTLLRGPLGGGVGEMDVRIFLFLMLATSLETFGDAIVRIGIGQTAWLPRTALFLGGAILLFGYGLSLNLAPIEFNRVVGLYIATLFIVWQIVNLIVFRTLPDMPILFGGALIVGGGLIVTFW